MSDAKTARRRYFDVALQNAAPHTHPLLLTLRDHDFDAALILSDDRSTVFSRSVPTVFVVSDTDDGGRGPAGFDPRTLHALFKTTAAVLIISGPPDPRPFALAATVMVQDHAHMALVETEMAFELEWATLAQRVNPAIVLHAWTYHPAGRA